MQMANQLNIGLKLKERGNKKKYTFFEIIKRIFIIFKKKSNKCLTRRYIKENLLKDF
jgi:hypothetical protein